MTERLHGELNSTNDKAAAELADCRRAAELEAWRVRYLGRRGAIPRLLRRLKDVPVAERRAVGRAGNDIRKALTAAYEAQRRQLRAELVRAPEARRALRRTVVRPPIGHLHPITLTVRRLQSWFVGEGFLVVEGPHVEEARYNFDLLNMPPAHPARAETDTFYLSPDLVLRTHTSPVQIRAVRELNLTPPFRILSPGRVFRVERTDATHETTFHQFEGLVVDDTASVATFRALIERFYSDFFDQPVSTRLRPSYFPYVEPGFEIDLTCIFCGGRGETRPGGICRLCQGTGWIEMMGAGIVHRDVLRNMNVDPDRWVGYAFGGAVDRLAMLRHGINDIRLFWSGDMRFLQQFS